MKTRRMILLILAAVLLVCTAMMTTAYAITDDDVAGAEEIQTGDVLQVNEFSEEDPKVCRFTPEEDGYYVFESASEESVDTFGIVYLKNGIDDYEEIAYNDDSDKDSNFSVTFKAEKDKEYYLFAKPYSGTITAHVSLSLTKSPISQMTFEPVSPYEYTEYRGGYWTEDDDDNEYYRYYIPDEEDFEDGDKLTLTISGTDVTYIFDKEEYAFVAGEEKIKASSVYTNDTQKRNHWTPDKETNSFELVYHGITTMVPVTLNPSNITSISYKPIEDYVYLEHDIGSGDWEYDRYENKYFEYARPDRQNGDILTVKTTDDPDGTDYVYNSEDEVYTSKDGDKIDYDEVFIRDDQYNTHWYPDTENYVTVMYANKTCQVKVLIKESDVTAISFEPATPYRFVEGDEHYGEWVEDNNDNMVFVYSTPVFKNGDILTVTRTGKDPERYVYDEENEVFVYGDDQISKYSLTRKMKGEWALGDKNKLEIGYLDQTCEVVVTILPNPVKSITFTPIEDYVMVKGDGEDGWWLDDETGLIWIYFTPSFRVGDVLSVTTDEGTNDYVLNDDGVFIGEKGDEDIINRWQVHRIKGDNWAPGNNNELKVFYAGSEVKVPVTIYDEHKHDDSTMVPVAKVEPTCGAEGCEAHYDCPTCHQHFHKDEEEGEYYKRALYELIIPKLPHTNIKHVAMKKATAKAAGNIEYWTCTACGTCFSDAEGKTEIAKKDTVIPKNNFKVTAKKKQYTAKSNKKTTLKAKALYNVKNKKGAVTYKKANKVGKSKITVAKSGTITVKKGIKKGTYNVRVKVTSAATDKYRACVKYVTIKIKVK